METENLGAIQRPWLFQPGQSGNPAGKPKGRVGGRAAALLELDAMMGAAENRQVLREALQEHFDADPVRFFRQIIMPLLPTEVKMMKRYEYQITPNGSITYNAPSGYHDDCVIALALANSERFQFKWTGEARVFGSRRVEAVVRFRSRAVTF